MGCREYISAYMSKFNESIVVKDRPLVFNRDRLLSHWLPLLAELPLTVRMYEDGALLRDCAAVRSFSRILHTLNEFTVTLETALVKGVEL